MEFPYLFPKKTDSLSFLYRALAGSEDFVPKLEDQCTARLPCSSMYNNEKLQMIAAGNSNVVVADNGDASLESRKQNGKLGMVNHGRAPACF